MLENDSIGCFQFNFLFLEERNSFSQKTNKPGWGDVQGERREKKILGTKGITDLIRGANQVVKRENGSEGEIRFHLHHYGLLRGLSEQVAFKKQPTHLRGTPPPLGSQDAPPPIRRGSLGATRGGS